MPCRGGPACPPPPWGTPRRLPHRQFLWSKPPGLPCRRSRRQSNIHPSCTGVPIAIRRQDWWRGPHDCALHLNPPPQGGACRQACHAGGHAGRATQSRAVRLFHRHPVRMTAHSTSTRRPLFSHLRVLRVLRGLLFSVPSVSCPMWGRLSSLRPAFQPAWAPFTHGLSSTQSPRRPKWSKPPGLPCRHFLWSKPPGLPCRRSRRQSHTHATRTGFPNAIQPARLRTPPQPAPSLPISVFSVPSVVWFSPCSLWFVFPVPSPPPVTTFPKSFSLSFSTTSQLPLSPSLAPILYVESERCG